jgi:hypothetical protein
MNSCQKNTPQPLSKAHWEKLAVRDDREMNEMRKKTRPRTEQLLKQKKASE